jgi:Retrotransposon gag protein
LLNQIDKEVYQTLRRLCDPAKLDSKTFDEIHAMLRRQYVPITPAWNERRKFIDSLQKPTESVSQWYLRLKLLAAKCDFGQEMNEMLKTRFVSGLANPAIFERISKELLGLDGNHSADCHR